jgi:hypothetical protein
LYFPVASGSVHKIHVLSWPLGWPFGTKNCESQQKNWREKSFEIHNMIEWLCRLARSLINEFINARSTARYKRCNKFSYLFPSPLHGRTKMKIQYNKNEIIAAARYLLENNPSSKIPSEIPYTDRGYLPERGHVDDILNNMRVLAKENKEVFEAVQHKLAAGDKNVDRLWQKWIEVLGVGGYWIIANMQGSTINLAIAVSPWFGDYLSVEEDI